MGDDAGIAVEFETGGGTIAFPPDKPLRLDSGGRSLYCSN